MPVRRAVVAGVFGLGAFVAVSAQQTPFRSSTEIVPVYATVQDRDLRLVPNLKQEDFVVTDNGRPQPITVFSNEAQPFSVVVMLDRSGSMHQHQFLVRDAASEFIKRLTPEDKARIGSFGNYVGNRVVISPPEFTSNHNELIEVMSGPIRVGENSPLWIAVDQSIVALSSRPGRRIVLVFSDGYDIPAKTIREVKLDDLIERARENNVMVYALGFAQVEETLGREPRITRPHRGLRELAEDSGGGYFEVLNPHDLGSLFTRIAEELHRQYLLGYVPPSRDGKIHTIRVTVKHEGMTVRARQSYVASK